MAIGNEICLRQLGAYGRDIASRDGRHTDRVMYETYTNTLYPSEYVLVDRTVLEEMIDQIDAARRSEAL